MMHCVDVRSSDIHDTCSVTDVADPVPIGLRRTKTVLQAQVDEISLAWITLPPSWKQRPFFLDVILRYSTKMDFDSTFSYALTWCNAPIMPMESNPKGPDAGSA